MAKAGKAGTALGIATISSAFGGLFSAIVLMSLTPLLADFALQFGPAEYFAIAALGLSCIANIGGGSVLKGLLAGAIGLLIACIGMDPQTGYARYTFGNINLLDGVGLVPALIGIFAVVSVLKSAEECKKMQAVSMPDVSSLWIGWRQFVNLLPTWIRGSVIGTVIGIIPGPGTSVATFMAYDMEKKISKDPDSFGKGNPKGVAAPESANNALAGGSLVPLLALGVPGNATSALFLGAIMFHGIRTGPVFFIEHPDVIYGLFVAFFIANLIMAPLGLFLLKYMKAVLSIPESLLGGIILAFCATGVFAIRGNPFDVLVVIVFGLLGYLFYKIDMPTAPLIIAIVLGPMAETNLRMALVVSRGSWSFLYTRPITLAMMIIAVLSFSVPLISAILSKYKASRLASKDTAGR